jgi:predicted SAM-dependent methyltransferase
MGYVERRGEFIREELLYELRYGGQREDKITPEVEVAILSPDKLAAMGDNIRLNLGAGHIPEPGYLNVDFRAVPGIDITADIRHLPFSPGELAEIRSAHLLEHFPLEELRRSILPTWVELLKDGGLFVAVVPDMASMVRAAAEGNIPMADFLKVTYGGQEYEGDFHFTGFTPESMRELFEDVGLTEVVVREQGRPNGMCLEMEIAATRRLAS